MKSAKKQSIRVGVIDHLPVGRPGHGRLRVRRARGATAPTGDKKPAPPPSASPDAGTPTPPNPAPKPAPAPDAGAPANRAAEIAPEIAAPGVAGIEVGLSPILADPGRMLSLVIARPSLSAGSPVSCANTAPPWPVGGPARGPARRGRPRRGAGRVRTFLDLPRRRAWSTTPRARAAARGDHPQPGANARRLHAHARPAPTATRTPWPAPTRPRRASCSPTPNSTPASRSAWPSWPAGSAPWSSCACSKGRGGDEVAATLGVSPGNVAVLYTARG